MCEHPWRNSTTSYTLITLGTGYDLYYATTINGIYIGRLLVNYVRKLSLIVMSLTCVLSPDQTVPLA